MSRLPTQDLIVCSTCGKPTRRFVEIHLAQGTTVTREWAPCDSCGKLQPENRSMTDPIPANKGEQREAMRFHHEDPAPTPQRGISPEEASYNVDLLIRMDRLDARLASLEIAYADVRGAQNQLERLLDPVPPSPSGLSDCWIDPLERSPDEGQDVLVWRKCWDQGSQEYDYLIVIARYETRDLSPEFHSGHDGEILFWRRLPDPPDKS